MIFMEYGSSKIKSLSAAVAELSLRSLPVMAAFCPIPNGPWCIVFEANAGFAAPAGTLVDRYECIEDAMFVISQHQQDYFWGEPTFEVATSANDD